MDRHTLKQRLSPIVRYTLQPIVVVLAVFTAFSFKLLQKFNLGEAVYRIFLNNGFHLVKRHYYSPIPDETDLSPEYWAHSSALVGIEMNPEAALALTGETFATYLEEFRARFPIHPTAAKDEFFLVNGTFMAGDAHLYYAFIRHSKPKRIIEIGAGASTQVAAAACLKNATLDGKAPHLTAIEPYPSPLLKRKFPGLSEVIEKKVQAVDLSLFTSLEAGDILFIDSSHVLREGNDVVYEYGEILPRLAPGVLVHIHDINLPYSYGEGYFKARYYWNEQYLLQAFLTYNSRFEVLWAGVYLTATYPEEMRTLFPEIDDMQKVYPMSGPSSFWMRVKPEPTP